MSARKQKPAGDVAVKLGDLFPGLPSDLHKAAEVMAKGMSAADGMRCEDARQMIRGFYTAMWAILLNEAIQHPGIGPKGPKLPPDVRFVDLVPHLLEARQVMAAKETRLDDWVLIHEWPGHMHPKPKTVRQWLSRYSRQIDAYGPTSAAASE